MKFNNIFFLIFNTCFMTINFTEIFHQIGDFWLCLYLGIIHTLLAILFLVLLLIEIKIAIESKAEQVEQKWFEISKNLIHDKTE